MANYFPHGVVVFFRLLPQGANSFVTSVHPLGRDVLIGGGYGHEEDYIVVTEEGVPLGFFPRDFVAAILPLDPGAPINAANPPSPAQH